ncbi:MAG: fibronectin type III domain-containing protein [Ruminococcaceae bacterium]|nr:fibronectin type III domain-containing protein [Oscillospiraceae bacterium]
MKKIKCLTTTILCLIAIASIIPIYSISGNVPKKPTNFRAVTVTADAVELTWSASEGASGYRVYTLLDGKWKILKDTKSTSAVITGLNASRTYTFAVKSATVTSSGTHFCDGYSSLKVKTKELGLTILSGRAGLNAVELTWDRVPGAAGYAVYQHNGSKWVLLGTSKKVVATVRNLKSATSYYFGVRPFTNSDSGVLLGAASNILKINTLDPNKVKVACTAATDTAVKISWSKANSASGYRVYAYVSGVWKPVKDVYGADTLSCVFKNLTSDTEYYFRVRAFAKKGAKVTWFTPSDVCRAITNPGVKDVYIHRVENLRSIFEAEGYTISYDNVTKRFGSIPVTISKNADSYYLYTKVNEMPYVLLNKDEDSYIILEEIESYIKIPDILKGTFDVKSTMEELLPGDDWTAKASVVTFNGQKVVCEHFVNASRTKGLKFYFKTGKLIAIDEIGLGGLEARAMIKSVEASSNPSNFVIPDGYDKLFFSSLEDFLIN